MASLQVKGIVAKILSTIQSYPSRQTLVFIATLNEIETMAGKNKKMPSTEGHMLNDPTLPAGWKREIVFTGARYRV